MPTPVHSGLLLSVASAIVFLIAGFLFGSRRKSGFTRKRHRDVLHRVQVARQVAQPISENVPPIPDSQETVYRQLAQNIRQVFWMADCRHGKLIYVSPAMLDLWLVEPRVIIHDLSQWFASIHFADRSQAEESITAMLKGHARTCEYRVVRPDGEIRSVRNRSFPVHDDSGDVSRMAGIIEDVTSERDAQRELQTSRDELVQHVNELKSENRERRRAEEQFRTAKDLAEAGSRAKSQFLSNISHELRTPLNGIMGMVQISLDSQLSDDQRECLQSAANSAAHLLDVVDNILDFSETDTGRMEIVSAPFDLRKCVRDVVSRMSPQLFGETLEFAYFVSADVPEIPVGDARRLAQVLTHLLSNAAKFTSQGSIGLEVIPIQEDAQGRPGVRFVVSDTGIGIAAANLEAIFESFTQGDGSLTRPYGGLGLGLSISSRLVALMGGRMSVQSEPAKGSRFEFTLPLVGRGLTSNPAKEGSPSGRGVLIVGTDSPSRSFAERAVREEGLAPSCCSSAEQALAALRDKPQRFGAILLASELAGSSGFDLAERLSNEFGLRDQLLMILEHSDEKGQVARCHELGVGGYFVRPLNYDDVRERLRSRMAASPASSAPASPVVVPNMIPPASSLRVLLVEDNPINQTVLKRMLQKQGHSVQTADQGFAALRILEEVDWQIDLILMDMQMPELDGYETTARIRVLEKTRGGHMPIIAATAHAMAGDAERCLNAGMDGYITKPIQIAVLSKAIAKVMSTALLSSQLNRKVS